MKTFLPQNQFISNSVSHVPVDAGSAVASPCPPSTAAAVAISEAAGKHPFPSVSADSEHEQQRKTLGVTDGRDHHLTDHINEIFFYARKLMKQPPRFVLDEARFLADIEETPLFLREDGYLQRREA